MMEEAEQEGCKTVVISFDPHPKMVLHPDRRPFYLISSAEEKINLLREIGIGAFLVIPFSLEYSRTTAREFVRDMLWEKLRIRKVTAEEILQVLPDLTTFQNINHQHDLARLAAMGV